MFTGMHSTAIRCSYLSFLGVVVENFSYIYQQRRNSTLNREEMRSFKKVWAIFDPRSTGFLEHKKIVPFLAVGIPFSISEIFLKTFIEIVRSI